MSSMLIRILLFLLPLIIIVQVDAMSFTFGEPDCEQEPCSDAIKEKSQIIKVMTYNIHYGMNIDYTNRGKNSALDAVIKFINDYDIDIAIIQEFPHGKYKFGNYLEGDRKRYKSYVRKNLKGKYSIVEEITRNGYQHVGGKSLVIISKFPVLEKEVLALPKEMWYQKRKTLMVKLKVGGKFLWVVNTHLYYDRNLLNHGDLTSSLNWIKKTIPSTDPVVFGGDLNFDIKAKGTLGKKNPSNIFTTGPYKHKLITSANFKDSYNHCISDKKYKQGAYRSTFVTKKKIRIDYLFFRNLSCKDYWREDTKSSDHYPVFTSYEFPKT